MKIEQIYKLYSNHFLVDTDTRKIRKGSIFFALKGNNFNANAFAEKAIEKGAIYSIVDQKKYQTDPRIILVNNVLDTLQKLARYHRKQLAIPIIAITGSNGKTTTKELINSVLSKKYKTVATLGNLNNHIGVPLTLLSMSPKTEMGIVEMGANNFGEIAFLSSIVNPDFGYITNFGKAHLKGFGNIEGVIKAKSELYDFLKKNDKTIFVNSEDDIQLKKTENANRILFENTICFKTANPFVKLSYKNILISSQLIGRYNFDNIAIAITIGQTFGVIPSDIKRAIESYTPDNNRSQIIQKQGNKIILDAYNANPTSMKLALESFKSIEATKKTVILGDMLELGQASSIEHQNIVNTVSSLCFENVILVGENFYHTQTNHLKFKDFEDLKKHLKNNPISNSALLIKGSRSMALERVLEYI